MYLLSLGPTAYRDGITGLDQGKFGIVPITFLFFLIWGSKPKPQKFPDASLC